MIIIRTQDKETLVKCITICYRQIYCKEKYYTLFGINGAEKDGEFGWVLGKYKTKKRLLEVLDEIQKVIKGDLYCIDDKNNIKVMQTTKFYEMPKE